MEEIIDKEFLFSESEDKNLIPDDRRINKKVKTKENKKYPYRRGRKLKQGGAVR